MANANTTKRSGHKTAVLYARYSSDKQREASIDDQLRVCHDYCEVEGIEVIKAYTDYALSGKTDQRPQFRQMIANAPESDYVVVYMFDRFSRDRYDSATYKKALRECGVRVISATEKVEDTPEGGLQEGLLEILSEYYVADLARKVRRGMEGNALKAKNNGYKIFGYATDPQTRKYVIDDVEAEVVREVFARYIDGESQLSIANKLASEGWTTSTGAPVESNWVRRILGREAYTGIYQWGGIRVEGGMPQIISKETFRRAQTTPRAKTRKNEKWAKYRLSGKLYCGLCGKRMHGFGGTGKTGRRYYYYGCKEKGGCHRSGVRREYVEDALADVVLRVTADEEQMRELARRVAEASQRDSETKAQLESCDEQIATLVRERQNLSKAARMGFITEETVQRNNEITDLLDGLQKRRDALARSSTGFTQDEVLEFLAHGIDKDDEEFIYEIFTNRVFLFDDYMVAIFNFRDKHCELAEVKAAIEEQTDKKEFSYLSLGTRRKRKTPAQKELGSLSSGVPSNLNVKLVSMRSGLGFVIRLKQLKKSA